jgi:alkyldihydroxyacetonephosphate synthase
VLRAPGALNRVVDALGGRVLRGSTLILIFEGRPGEPQEDMAVAARIASEIGARALGEQPARHWLEHRYGVSYRQAPVFMAGAFSDTMEVAAPWSRLEGLYRAVREALGRHVFVMAHLSHAYPDGCSIYFTFAGSAPDPTKMEQTYDAAWRAALDAAVGAGGTLSHHHGVGRSKAPRLGTELGAGVDVVRALARELDPAGIMNPGNLLPAESPSRRPPSPSPREPAIDRESMLVHASGDAKLSDVERALAGHAWTLGLAEGVDLDAFTVDAWIAAGAPGAPDPWLDPVDHTVAGFSATLTGGAHLEVKPCPRRAVGPDLYALFHGTTKKVGRIASAHLRVHGAGRPRPLTTSLDRNPTTSDRERAWIDRLLAAAARID